jgi:nitrite reductase/ring-hydroxylating ferredoxin subunit
VPSGALDTAGSSSGTAQGISEAEARPPDADEAGGSQLDFVKVADASEVPPGSMKMFTVGDVEVLVTNVAGKFYAIGGLCTHMKGNLSQGKLEGNVVTCPRHGSQFDVTNGKSLRGPKIALIRLTTKDEPSYEVKLDGSSVMVKV